jgi:tetratricopeptide (TPR) repeat protein
MVQTNRLDLLAPQISALLAQDAEGLPANLMQLNRLLSRHADKKAVQKLVERVTAPYGHIPEAHFAKSQAASHAGDEAVALDEIEKTLQLRPDWEPAALIRAQLQVRASSAQAIEGLQFFVRRYPEARDARLMLARLLITEKRYDESRVHFDVLVKSAPNSPELIYPLAMLALQQGDAKLGRAQLERLLQTDFPDKSSIHFFIGQIDEDQKNLDSALANYQLVVSGEQYLAARTRMVLILQQQGKLDAARETIRATRTTTLAEQVQILLAESLFLRETGREAEAYRLLESALIKIPDSTELLYETALLAERQGKPEVLEKHLKRLLEIKPDHAHALNALGYSLADRNIRLGEAEKLIAQALQQTPDDPFILDSQGWVFFRQGRLSESLAVLQRAYGLKRDGEIAAHLGEVLWALNRKEEARRLLLEASKEHPDNEVLSAFIKKLLP